MNVVLLIKEILGITCYTLRGETWVPDNNKENNVLMGNTIWSSIQHNNVRIILMNMLLKIGLYIYIHIYIYIYSPHGHHCFTRLTLI